MGRLSGFSYQKVTKKLRKLGFEFYQSAKGDHEIWFNPETFCKTTIPHHKQTKEGTLRNILKQAKIDVDTFVRNIRRSPITSKQKLLVLILRLPKPIGY